MNGNKEVEYSQSIAYIHHMYETRHKAFHFMLLINAAMIAVAFNSSAGKTSLELLPLAVFGFFTTLSLLLFALRNSKATNKFEEQAIRIESEIGFNLIKTTHAKSIGGIDSTVYLLAVYAICTIFWGTFSTYHAINILSN